MQNLILSGHSMGSATSLLVGEQDDRVKVVLCHDPWSKVIDDKIPKFDKLLSKYVQIISGSHFAADDHDGDPFGDKLKAKWLKKDGFESIVVDKTHHFQ